MWSAEWADYIKTYLWTLYAYEQYGGQPTDLGPGPQPGQRHGRLPGRAHRPGLRASPRTTCSATGPWRTSSTTPPSPTASTATRATTCRPSCPSAPTRRYPASRHRQRPGLGDRLHPPDRLRRARRRSASTAPTTGDFRVTVLARDPSLPTLVEWVPLDAAQDGPVEFTAAAGYDEVVVSVANVSRRRARATATPSATRPRRPFPSRMASSRATPRCGAPPSRRPTGRTND